jgi:hypothetical protein
LKEYGNEHEEQQRRNKAMNKFLIDTVFTFVTITTANAESLWGHNGSTVYLVAKGSSRQFYYQNPRPGMLQAGARPGTLLFTGKAAGLSYAGTAYVFNSVCGAFGYQVSGPILDNYNRVVLTGYAPRINPDCSVGGYVHDTLEFALLAAPPPVAYGPTPPPPPPAYAPPVPVPQSPVAPVPVAPIPVPVAPVPVPASTPPVIINIVPAAPVTNNNNITVTTPPPVVLNSNNNNNRN